MRGLACSQHGQILDIEYSASILLSRAGTCAALRGLLADKLSVFEEGLLGEPLGVETQLLINERVVDQEQCLGVLGANELVFIVYV